MNNQSWIVGLLSSLLDMFKTKHAGVYGVIILILGAVYAIVTFFQGDTGLDLPSWLDTAIKIAAPLLAALLGSHTPQKSNGK